MPTPVKQQVWSQIDVFGLLNGLSTWDSQYKNLQYIRKPFDSGLELRERIFREHDNPPGVDKQGLLNGLCNEFNIDPYNVTNKKTFTLSTTPVRVDNEGIQDVFVYYREPSNSFYKSMSSSGWIELLPQTWLPNTSGFVVWQNSFFFTNSGVKNFDYSTTLEVFESLSDQTELKVVYSVYVNNSDNTSIDLVNYTDMSNPQDSTDTRFIYRTPQIINPLSGIIAYNLEDIPSNIENKYYNNDGTANNLLYVIRDYINRKFAHTWDKITDKSCIWDISKSYGSGDIPHMYDAYVPKNKQSFTNFYISGVYFPGYIGGIEDQSYALYASSLDEMDSGSWYVNIYPGEFYLEGIPFHVFENPVVNNIALSSGSGVLPTGFKRGMYCILANSGYYDDPNGNSDPYLSGIVYEDYCYNYNTDGTESPTNYIYRRRPNISSNMGPQTMLGSHHYCIDYTSNQILAGSGINNTVFIWDNTFIPSGRYLQYDVNPLNNNIMNIDKYFLYITLGSGIYDFGQYIFDAGVERNTIELDGYYRNNQFDRMFE